MSRLGGEAGLRRTTAFSRVEWFTSMSLLLFCVVLRVHAASLPGGLWRDEVNSVNLAQLPTVADLYRHLEYDSFPMFWLLILQGYEHRVGSSDAQLRVLGFVLSLTLPLASWWTCRQFKVRPLLVFLFAGVSPLFVIWAGVQTRAYGLAAGLAMVVLGSSWRLVTRPGTASLVLLALFGLAAVQSSFHNVMLVFSAFVAAGAVLVKRRRMRELILIGITGIIAGASLLIYLPGIRSARRWTIVVGEPRDPKLLWVGLRGALAQGGQAMPAVFVLLTVAASIFLFVEKHAPDQPRLAECSDATEGNMALFLAALLSSLFAGQAAFLLFGGYLISSWYYLTPILTSALAMDVLWGRRSLRRGIGMMRLSAAAILSLVWLPADWTGAELRRTNVDQVGSLLTELTTPDDLVVVFPFFVGVSLSRYYHGAARLMTLPDLAFTRWHRFDLLKEKYGDPRAAFPVLDNISRTLGRGGRLWFVGAMPWQQADGFLEQPPLPGPAAPPGNWKCVYWDTAWAVQATYLLKSHGVDVRDCTPASTRTINVTEDEPLLEITGGGPWGRPAEPRR